MVFTDIILLGNYYMEQRKNLLIKIDNEELLIGQAQFSSMVEAILWFSHVFLPPQNDYHIFHPDRTPLSELHTPKK